MSIPALATAISQGNLQSQVSYAVARKTLDSAQSQGDAIVAMIQNAAGAGKTGDPLAAAATGRGGQIDVYG